MVVRAVAACVTFALLFAGPLQPMVLAQTAPPPAPPAAAPAAPPAAPPAATPPPSPPPPPATPPVPPPPPAAHGTDVYDVAAGAVTVLKAPFNVVLCGLGTGVAAALFAITFGSAYKASARVVEQGCRGPWVVTGEDLRPPSSSAQGRVGYEP
jgi:hypothetical protein